MILLHKDGSIIEAGSIEFIRPISRNMQTGELSIEINFASGKTARYTDVWYAKGCKDKTSIYDALLGGSFPVDWREYIKVGG